MTLADFAWARAHGIDVDSTGDLLFELVRVTEREETRTRLGEVLRRRVTDEELAEVPLKLIAGRSALPALRALDMSACCELQIGEQANRALHFYSVVDDFGEFSNFALFAVTISGMRWPTSEHYFQAQKFKDPKDQAAVRAAKTPMIAARLGRDRKRKLRRDWESVKDAVMKTAVDAKFRQHDELRELLLSTGTRKLVEHTDSDAYWGDGGDGTDGAEPAWGHAHAGARGARGRV